MLNRLSGERQLAYVATISSITPIEKADFIETAHVNGWQVVVKKGDFKVGEKVIYIEIDSRVPSDKECFSFLEDKKFKVKTIKLRGQYSQGLVVPMSILEEYNINKDYEVGTDLTQILGITKVEENIDFENFSFLYPKTYNKLMKFSWFKKIVENESRKRFILRLLGFKPINVTFPTKYLGLKKTDQERCENIFNEILERDDSYYVTTKIDGTSMTVIYDKRKEGIDRLQVYSRTQRKFTPYTNMNSLTKKDGVYWEAVKSYKLHKVLENILERTGLNWVALQGEVAGSSNLNGRVQGNPHKFDKLRFFGFNLVLEGRGVLDIAEAKKLYLECGGIEWVPIVKTDYKVPNSLNDFKESADGLCEAWGSSGIREGYVYRSKTDPEYSFKNISNKYLLKHDN